MLVQYNKQWELNTEWCTLPLDIENFAFEEYWRKPMWNKLTFHLKELEKEIPQNVHSSKTKSWRNQKSWTDQLLVRRLS